VIREKLRGFGANVWDLIGNQIIFQLENVWTDSTSSWTGGAFGPPWTRRQSAAGARRSAHRVLRGGRGRRRGAHRGKNQAVRWRGCAGAREDQSSVAVLGVEQAEALRSETRSGTSCGVVL
jgi:hypothetical protein